MKKERKLKILKIALIIWLAPFIFLMKLLNGHYGI